MNIEENIQKWYELRELINQKEKEMEKYKSEVSKYMIDNELDEIKSGSIRVKKSVCNRDFLNKKDVPKDIWEKYSKKNSYYTFKLSG
jgi:hypothetical protein